MYTSARRRLITILGVMSLTVAAAACGGSDEAETEGTSDGSAAAVTAAPSESGAPAASGEPILIGVPLNQSGPVGVADHKDFQNGAEMAVEEINAAGGVGGRPLQLEIVDQDILSPEGVTAGFQALAEKNVSGIISPFVLVPPPGMDAAAAYGAPYLNGNTSIDGLELVKSDPAKYANVFSLDGPETFYGEGLIPYLAQLQTQGWTPTNNKIHIIQGEINYTKVISEATQAAIAESGGEWELAKVTEIQSGIQDWAPVIQEIKSTGAGFVMVDHWVAAELAAFAQQFSADPLEGALVYLQYGPSQPEFLDLAGDAAEGFIWGTVYGVYADEQGTAFRTAYMEKYTGTMGLVYSGGGYDAVHLLAEAWKTADPSDFAASSAAIRALEYRGVNGFYQFDNEWQAPLTYPEQTDNLDEAQAHLILQVQGGAHTIILPDPAAEATFTPAPWMQ